VYVALTRPSDAVWPENLAVTTVLHLAAVGVGAMILNGVVRRRWGG
jgi:hypothetical protein